jgi:hypothetical protein
VGSGNRGSPYHSQVNGGNQSPPFSVEASVHIYTKLSELYRPSDRSLSAMLVPTFADRGCHMVSVTDPLRPYSRFSIPVRYELNLYMLYRRK